VNGIIEGKISNVRVIDLISIAEKSNDWKVQEELLSKH
jgi:hypothetical protein